MNLQDLISAGALSGSTFNDVVKKSVEWEGKTFDVFIKREMSAADFEALIRNVDGEESVMARKVSLFVALKDGERIPFETAMLFKPSLLLKLASAIGDVHDKTDQAETAGKKPSRKRKKSGMS